MRSTSQKRYAFTNIAFIMFVLFMTIILSLIQLSTSIIPPPPPPLIKPLPPPPPIKPLSVTASTALPEHLARQQVTFSIGNPVHTTVLSHASPTIPAVPAILADQDKKDDKVVDVDNTDKAIVDANQVENKEPVVSTLTAQPSLQLTTLQHAATRANTVANAPNNNPHLTNHPNNIHQTFTQHRHQQQHPQQQPFMLNGPIHQIPFHHHSTPQFQLFNHPHHQQQHLQQTFQFPQQGQPRFNTLQFGPPGLGGIGGPPGAGFGAPVGPIGPGAGFGPAGGGGFGGGQPNPLVNSLDSALHTISSLLDRLQGGNGVGGINQGGFNGNPGFVNNGNFVDIPVGAGNGVLVGDSLAGAQPIDPSLPVINF